MGRWSVTDPDLDRQTIRGLVELIAQGEAPWVTVNRRALRSVLDALEAAERERDASRGGLERVGWMHPHGTAFSMDARRERYESPSPYMDDWEPVYRVRSTAVPYSATWTTTPDGRIDSISYMEPEKP